MKILLHIGWPKTGSTAIQQFLHANRAAILKRSGVLYPEAGIHTVAHHLAAWSLHEPLTNPWAREIGFNGTPEQVFGAIFAEARLTGARSLIISSEAFFATSRYRISRLAEVLAGHEVRVMAYLRRQDEYVESAYKQAVRGHARLTKTFEAFTHTQHRRGRLDYDALFQEWDKQFPGIAVTIRPYDRERFPERNVVRDFMNVAGIPSGDWNFSASDINLSLSAESAVALAWINANMELASADHERAIEALRTIEAADGDTSKELFTPAARAALMRRLDKSNERLFRRYCGEENPFTFVEKPAQEGVGRPAPDGSNIKEEVMLKRISQVIGKLARGAEGGKLPVSADVAESRWLQAHLDRAAGRPAGPEPVLPLPPADLVKRLNGQDLESALRHGFAFYLRIKALIAGAGMPLEKANVLDFGCGWGRHIRFLIRDLPAQNITGSDVTARNLELCRKQIPGVRFEQNNTLPPLAHADGTFDVVYAQSVFSHLPENAHKLWFRELLRVLRPGGVLVLTTNGSQHFVQQSPALKRAFDETGYVFVPTIKGNTELGEWGRTAISESYVQREWGPHLDGLIYSYEPGKYPQAVISGRKR